MNRFFGNITGSFSDGAILFPIIVALSATTHFNSAILFLTAGIAYICSGYLFRIPMPVQPLKSLVITAITIGATFTEIRISTLILGIIFLFFILLPFDKIISKIPTSIIHGVQLSLGILLISKGVEYALPQISTPFFILFALIIISTLTFSRFSLPLLGFFSLAGFIIAIFNKHSPVVTPYDHSQDLLRPTILLSLILPQIILTSVNSVVATVDATNRYFPEKSSRVTKRNLLYSIGIGNILASTIGGLPFCHGSGGLTAHFKGGSRDWWSNIFIGVTLLILSLLDFSGIKLIPNYPNILLSILLVSVGFLHMQLAKPTWVIKSERGRLVLMGLTTFLTHNLLFGFIIGFTPDIISFLKPKLLWSANR